MEDDLGAVIIAAERCGDWMPAGELREAALAALAGSCDVTFNLDKLDHLDASALQILLALDEEQRKRGRQLHVANVSPDLGKWFEYSGTAGQLIRWGA